MRRISLPTSLPTSLPHLQVVPGQQRGFMVHTDSPGGLILRGGFGPEVGFGCRELVGLRAGGGRGVAPWVIFLLLDGVL